MRYRIVWKSVGESIFFTRTLASARKQAKNLAKEKNAEMCVKEVVPGKSACSSYARKRHGRCANFPKVRLHGCYKP